MHSSATLTLCCLLSLGAFLSAGCAPHRSAEGDDPDLGAGDLSASSPRDLTTPCGGLACKQPRCGGQNTTTLSGTVYAPNGQDPPYNVLVPGACRTKALTPQERVLEFMPFDLTSCVRSDAEPPVIGVRP